MNRYQRRKSREIKQIMNRDKFGKMTYKDAKKLWKLCRRVRWVKPCKHCQDKMCNITT